ncbi:MAG TPA: TIGR03086 family metal-binding protein [Acidimicrobiia bacterium]|jgi:uncharacterized protein (TIGR03086 family)
MDVVPLLDEAVASTGKVVAGVRPNQLGDATPCTQWDVATLLNHVIGVAGAFSDVGEGAPIKPPDPRVATFDGDDYAAAYDFATAELLDAWRRPSVLDTTVVLPIGDVPGTVAASINFVDVLVHGWDLARATGQDVELSPHLAEPALQFSRGLVNDELRGAGAFGPEVLVPANMPASDRLVAFLGRTP